MFTFILCVALLIGALICYASCCAAANADRQSEEYWQKRNSENLKK